MSQRGGTCGLQVSLPNLHSFALPVFNGPYPTFTSGVGPLVPSTGSSWPLDKAFLWENLGQILSSVHTGIVPCHKHHEWPSAVMTCFVVAACFAVYDLIRDSKSKGSKLSRCMSELGKKSWSSSIFNHFANLPFKWLLFPSTMPYFTKPSVPSLKVVFGIKEVVGPRSLQLRDVRDRCRETETEPQHVPLILIPII